MTKKKSKDKYFTSSNERLFKLFMDMVKKKSFQNKIEELRKEYKIPKGGYKKMPKNHIDLGFDFFTFPEKWKDSVDEISLNTFLYKIDKLADDYKLGVLKAYPKLFYWLIFYGKIIFPDKIGNVVLQDMVEAKRRLRINNLRENYYYPVALLISVDASGEEIHDFVDTHLHRIKMKQNKYKNKAPKQKVVRLRELNEETKFIYKNKDKPVKEIIQLVIKKYEKVYGDSDIRRIIHNQDKKYK